MNKFGTYLKQLNSYEYFSPLEFSMLFTNGVDTHHLSDIQLTDLFNISESTAEEWKSGKSAPAYSCRLLVIQSLKKLTEDSLKVDR